MNDQTEPSRQDDGLSESQRTAYEAAMKDEQQRADHAQMVAALQHAQRRIMELTRELVTLRELVTSGSEGTTRD